MTCERALALIREIKDYADIPIGLLMYYNLVYHYGRERFYQDAAEKMPILEIVRLFQRLTRENEQRKAQLADMFSS